MEELLNEVGLNDKEAKVFLCLLENGSSTAANLSKSVGESRTNTYMILEGLMNEGLVEEDSSKVKKFTAVNPNYLTSILANKQRKIHDVSVKLHSRLPEMLSKYDLAHHKPGVVHRQGLEGFKESLLDMERCADEVLIIPSHITDDNKQAYDMLQKALIRRLKRGVRSRSVLHEGGREYKDIDDWPKKGIDVRFLGNTYYEGEVVIYADKCVHTVYAPEIVVTTITNKVIADTMRTVFENLWCSAKQ